MPDELHEFPTNAIRPKGANFGASVNFNPYSGLPPTLWHSAEFPLKFHTLSESSEARVRPETDRLVPCWGWEQGQLGS